jgi:hypothetical protein
MSPFAKRRSEMSVAELIIDSRWWDGTEADALGVVAIHRGQAEACTNLPGISQGSA